MTNYYPLQPSSPNPGVAQLSPSTSPRRATFEYPPTSPADSRSYNSSEGSQGVNRYSRRSSGFYGGTNSPPASNGGPNFAAPVQEKDERDRLSDPSTSASTHSHNLSYPNSNSHGGHEDDDGFFLGGGGGAEESSSYEAGVAFPGSSFPRPDRGGNPFDNAPRRPPNAVSLASTFSYLPGSRRRSVSLFLLIPMTGPPLAKRTAYVSRLFSLVNLPLLLRAGLGVPPPRRLTDRKLVRLATSPRQPVRNAERLPSRLLQVVTQKSGPFAQARGLERFAVDTRGEGEDEERARRKRSEWVGRRVWGRGEREGVGVA